MRVWRAALCALAATISSGADESSSAPQPGPEPLATVQAQSQALAAPPAPQPATIIDLQAAQQMAVAGNPSLKAAEERVNQARARVKQARSAWFPSVFALASASNTWISENDYERARKAASNGYWSSFALGTQARLQGETLQFAQIVGNNIAQFFNPTIHEITPGPTVTNTDRDIVRDLITTSLYSVDARDAVKDQFERYTISVVAEWIVFNGFERKFSIAEARFGTQQIEAAYLESHRVLLDAVAQAYYAAQLARENIAIAEADEKFNQRQLDEAKARRRVGTGSLSDELNFEVRVNAARASLITARQSYNTSLIALAELLALQDARFPETMGLAPLEEETLETLSPPDADPLVQLAKERRPDLTASELGIKRAGAAVGRAKAPFYPQISARVSRDALRIDNTEFGEDDFSTSIGANVSYELFAGGRNVARLQETKSARSEAEHLAAQIELQVASEVRSSVEQLKAAQDRLVLQRANAAFVQRNRDLVEKEYAGGVGSLVRLNEAQRDLVAAQANLAFARVQLRAAWHNVRTATAETVLPYSEKDAQTVSTTPAAKTEKQF